MEVGMSAFSPQHEGRVSGMTPRSLAARAGMWSAQHHKKAISGWLAFVVVAFMIGGAVGTKTLEHSQAEVGESGRADHAIADLRLSLGVAPVVALFSDSP